MDCNFFAKSLLCTWWLHFQENIFILGLKSVSSFSCNTLNYLLKACVCYFSEIFNFHQMIALQKLWKMFFLLCKKLFSLQDTQIFVFFLPASYFWKASSKTNLKGYDAFNCLKKNLITHFVWCLEKKKMYDIETSAIDTVLSKEHFYGKIIQKICTKS